jgi:hypothetical protein
MLLEYVLLFDRKSGYAIFFHHPVFGVFIKDLVGIVIAAVYGVFVVG